MKLDDENSYRNQIEWPKAMKRKTASTYSSRISTQLINCFSNIFKTSKKCPLAIEILILGNGSGHEFFSTLTILVAVL